MLTRDTFIKHKQMAQVAWLSASLLVPWADKQSRGRVLWNIKDAVVTKSWKDDEGRIAIVKLQKGTETITIGSVYAPNIDLSNNSQRIYNRFLQELEVYVSEAGARNETVIIAGDMNIIRHPTKEKSRGKRSEMGALMSLMPNQ